MKVFVLILMLAGAGDGGRAINTDLIFSTAAECESAAEAVRVHGGREMRFAPVAVCVSKAL